MNILLTGGTGYIGSHTAIKIHQNNHNVILYDNLSNSSKKILSKIKTSLGLNLKLIVGDVLDTKKLEEVLKNYEIEAVIHFAGLKSVDESILFPKKYFENNVNGSLSLIQAMKKSNVKKLIFSSSATVYGEPEYLPIDENHPKNPKNPYGKSKLEVENILKSLSMSDSQWKIVCLRYFNPIGSHENIDMGDNLSGNANNLFPVILKVLRKKIKILQIYGQDYDTKDGTGIRDYIYIMDLVDGHLAALNFLNSNNGWYDINLGTGIGYSVLETINKFQSVNNVKIPFKYSKRREGDVSESYADVKKAKFLLGWKAKNSLDIMCKSVIK